MGNNLSGPERLYQAVKSNNLHDCQKIFEQLRRTTGGESAKRQFLDWADGEGRTALTLAAARNHFQIAQLLLAEGADVHYSAPKRPTGGSALHEAVHHKHEALVELLLSHGASPFVENSAGLTAVDLASQCGHAGVLRRLERVAPFAGFVNVKVLQMKGLSHKTKDRWALVMPRYSQPLPAAPRSSQRVCTLRIVLWLFKDISAAEPRTKLWLDGAQALRTGAAGLDCVLRLHPNHEQPRNVYTKHDAASWLLFFKPAVNSANLAITHADFARFVDVCSRPLEHLAPAQPAAPAGVPVAPGMQAAAPRTNSSSGGGGGGGVRGSVGAQGFMAGGSLALRLQPAAAPPPTAQQRPQQQQPRRGSGDGRGAQLVAAPGETDEQFARRLAGCLQAGGGGVAAAAATRSAPHSRVAPGTGSTAAPRAASAVGVPAAAAAPAAQPPQATGWLRPAGGTRSADAVDTAPSAPPAPPFASNPFAASAWAPSDGGAPPPVQHALREPSASADGGRSAASMLSSQSSGEADMCVVCLCAPKDSGLLHGATVHRCVCRDCAQLLAVGQPCPMCRQPIERVLGVY